MSETPWYDKPLEISKDDDKRRSDSLRDLDYWKQRGAEAGRKALRSFLVDKCGEDAVVKLEEKQRREKEFYKPIESGVVVV